MPEVLTAPLAMLVLCAAPGAAAARWLGLPLRWRDAQAWALVLSAGFGIAPLVIFPAASLFGFTPVAIAAPVLLLSLGLALTAPRAPRAIEPVPFTRAALALLVLTLALVLAALVPFETPWRAAFFPGEGNYRIADWSKHYALVSEIEQSGVPPQNLFYYSDPSLPHPYYIFFHLIAASLDRLSGGGAGIGFWLTAAAGWAALAVALSVYVLARRLWHGAAAAHASLLCVTLAGGLDVIPALANYLMPGGNPPRPYVHIEGWNGCQSEISTFFTTYTWVPQHAASLALLLGAWLVHVGFRGSPRAPFVIALLLASALGYSLYVPLGAGIAVGALALPRIARAGRQAAIWLCAAFIAGLALLPYLNYLRAAQALTVAPLSLWVRTAGVPLWGLPSGTVWQSLVPQAGVLAQLLDVPLYLLIELGATAVLAWLAWRRFGGRLARGAWRAGAWGAAASLLLALFARSNLGCNDLGIRAILPFQAVLALWAGGGWLAAMRAGWRTRAALALAGALAAALLAWQVWVFVGGRFLPPYDADTAALDARSLAFADALAYLRSEMPPGAVLQVDPAIMAYDLDAALASGRPNYFYYDPVFVYQRPVGEVATRKSRVAEAFQMPTMNEACHRFGALRPVEILLLDATAPYPWLADLDEPESCFERLHQNDQILLLRLRR